jgi:hypothetical protein
MDVNFGKLWYEILLTLRPDYNVQQASEFFPLPAA